jgi:hypothetical protein
LRKLCTVKDCPQEALIDAIASRRHVAAQLIRRHVVVMLTLIIPAAANQATIAAKRILR